MSKPTFQKEGHILKVFFKRNGKGALEFEAWIGHLWIYTFARVFFLKMLFPVLLVTWCDSY
jgi:hypothetical protein